MDLKITESAINKISELLVEENNPNLKIRVFVQGGGCSGMQYGFSFDEDTTDDDFVIPSGASSVLVDVISAQYLEGAEIDYVDDLNGAQFKIRNPNAQTTCGCGSSFSPY